MKKIAGFLIGVLIITGCSSEEIGQASDQSEPTVKTIMDHIQEKISEDYNLMIIDGVVSNATTEEPLYELVNLLSAEETEFFPFATHFNKEDLKAGYMLVPMDDTSHSELIIVVEISEPKAITSVSHAMEKILSDQEVMWSDYMEEQYEFVRMNKIAKQGNFVLYVTSAHATEILKIFQSRVG